MQIHTVPVRLIITFELKLDQVLPLIYSKSIHLKLSTFKHFTQLKNLRNILPSVHREALTDDDDHGRRSPSVDAVASSREVTTTAS